MKRTTLVALCIAAIVLPVFLPALGGDFVYDDEFYITQNSALRLGPTPRGLLWALTDLHAHNWHPLTWVSHLLDVRLFDAQPWGHHLSSVILHTLAAVFLFLALRALSGAIWPAAAAALLFGIHPLHVESVAFISERKDVLSALLMMLCLLAYTRWARRGRPADYLLLLLLYTLGLMAKPMLVTLPFILLLVDWWPLSRGGPGGRCGAPGTPGVRRLLAEKLPFFALAGVSSVLTYIAQSRGGAVKSMVEIPFPARVANACISCLVYLRQMVWPVGLVVHYPHPGSGVSFPVAGVAALVLLGVTVLAWRLRNRAPWLLFGWIWYLVMLVPVIGIIQVGNQAHADRYTYLPLVGIFFAVVWGLARLVEHRPRLRSALPGIGVAVVAILVPLTVRQIGFWKDNLTLYTRAVRIIPANPLIWYNLGNAYDDLGRFDEAESALWEAIRLNPDFADAENNLGIIRSRRGASDEAVRHFLAAIAADPRHFDARYDLGIEYAKLGRLTEAEAAYREAIRLDPGNALARGSLGTTLSLLGRDAEGLEELRQAVRLAPRSPAMRYNAALVLQRLGRREEAIAAFTQVLRLEPDHPGARESLRRLTGE